MFRVLIFSVVILLFIGHAYSKTLPVPEPESPTPIAKQVLPKHKHSAACEQTTAEPVQIICILDRSGSMAKLADDTIGGYNSFIEQQRSKPGAAQVTTVIFDDRYEKIVDGVNLSDVPELTSAQYYARGTTALLDAVGMTITDVAGKMEREGICPAKRRVLIMIMTDGYENASREYRKADVKALIESTTNDYKWNYVFLGANIDSASEAGSIGISARHASNYKADASGVRESFSRMNEAADDVRERGTLDK